MPMFSLLFVLVVMLGLGLRLWLRWRQVSYVRNHRDAVPAVFAEKISLSAHRRAADYTIDRTRFGGFENMGETVIVLAWTLGGGLDALNRAWLALGLSPLLTGTGVLISAAVIMGLLDLPFTLWRTFVIETRHGFNHTTPGVFATDLIKQTLLALFIGTPLVLLILWLMQRMGGWWWLWVWAVWTAFTLGLAWAYPRFIAPLFNTFTPLDDGELRTRVGRLLDRAGFRSRGIFVMDGSRRSGHGNAYFTGFGRNKRIVFFDTLLNTLEPDEVEAVLAHELGHFRHRHVLKAMVLMTTLSLAGFALLAWLMTQPWFYADLGVHSPSTWSALLLFVIALPQFTYLLTPLFSWRSRRQEFEADAYARTQTGAAPLIQALTKLYRDNSSTLTPDPVHSAFYDSHPPASIRIQHLNAASR
ncbi:M48 family metallopeptidase [Acidihalobacter ferrooxydans]|uniref:Peptidase M48 n=1 Tax=Acidihalobacter ferrooxydans TaxID=1765967 RepID=A0A1P8UGE6_9GAMM|nr:M48 family metallopeptidase [Acidihalobacter ferrooxydans]APZ42870.1 peptidase M48 [Acidihalobacter ferrooxydans]